MSAYDDINALVVSRANLNVSTQDFNDALKLAEYRLYRECEALELIKTDSLAITDGVFTLPADFQRGRSLTIDGYKPKNVGYEKYQSIATRSNAWPPSYPYLVSIEGLRGYVLPAIETGTAALSYYGNLAPLTAIAGDNDFAINHQDLWVWAVLVEIMDFYEDDRIEKYNSRYGAVLDTINARAQASSAGLGLVA